MPTSTVTIRLAQKEDLDAIIILCAAHAAYEKCDYEATGKKERLQRDLFCASPILFCLIAEQNGKNPRLYHLYEAICYMGC